MNYSKNLRKAAVARRVLALTGMTLAAGLAVGGVSGYALKTYITANAAVTEAPQTIASPEPEFAVYGAYDDRIYTEEIPLDWSAGDLDFTPLDVPLDVVVQEFTYYLCEGYNIDFTLVMAMMQHESNFKVDVVSKTDDYGLMQINRCNHAELTEILGVTDYLDPYQNIRAGCYTVRKLFEKYQEPNMVLMAYNMGENGASRLWERGIYNTKYTDSILAIQKQFNELRGDTGEGKLESD